MLQRDAAGASSLLTRRDHHLEDTWMHAVRRMDRDTLDLFVRRTWRAWDATSLRPVQAAVDARRGELDGE
jgi:hypothetical protein